MWYPPHTLPTINIHTMDNTIKVLPQSQMTHHKLIRRFGSNEIFELIDPSFPDPVIVKNGVVLQPESLAIYLDRRKSVPNEA